MLFIFYNIVELNNIMIIEVNTDNIKVVHKNYGNSTILSKVLRDFHDVVII